MTVTTAFPSTAELADLAAEVTVDTAGTVTSDTRRSARVRPAARRPAGRGTSTRSARAALAMLPVPPPAPAVRPSRRPASTVRVAARPESCVGAPVVVSSAVRLTRRGWALLLAAGLAVAAVVVVLAALHHPADPAPVAAPTTVTVQAGDTLWSIAGRIAPDRDPRAVVFDLQRANHLGSAQLETGQVLRTG